MRRLREHVIIGLLSGSLCSGVAVANPYLSQAQAMVADAKGLTHAQVRYQYHLAAAASLEYLKAISEEVNEEKARVAQTLSDLDKDLGTIRAAAIDGSIEGFKHYAEKVAVAQRKAQVTQAGFTSLESYLLAARERVASFASFCETNIPLIKVANLKGFPSNHLIGPQINYTKYWTLSNSGEQSEASNFFAGDPVVDGAAIWASSLTFAGAMAYAIAKGGLSVAFVKASSGSLLVGFSVKLGSAVALSGAFIAVTAGVAVIAIAATIWANERNRERKADAEKKFAELERQYHEARDWYHAHIPDQDQIQKIAEEICYGPEYTSVLNDMREHVQVVLSDTHMSLQEVRVARESVGKISQSLHEAHENYKQALARVYEAKIIENAEKATKENESATFVWERFNKDIKPRIIEVKAQLAQMNSCAKKGVMLGQMRSEIEAEFHLLQDLDHGDLFKNEWANAKSRSLKALHQMESMLKDCAMDVTESGDVYEF